MVNNRAIVYQRSSVVTAIGRAEELAALAAYAERVGLHPMSVYVASGQAH